MVRRKSSTPITTAVSRLANLKNDGIAIDMGSMDGWHDKLFVDRL
jgi:hypothetical protein